MHAASHKGLSELHAVYIFTYHNLIAGVVEIVTFLSSTFNLSMVKSARRSINV